MALDGKPYWAGGGAYHPETKERTRVNFYGGYVCSSECDYRSSLNQEQDMPGASGKVSTLSAFAAQSHRNNWT